MQWIKIAPEKIFDGYRFLTEHVLVLQPDGTVEAVIPANEVDEGVLRLDGIIAPGFINCHCHLELSHLKGRIDKKTGLPAFVRQVVQKRNVATEIIQQAIIDAENEMIENGIVAVGDICNTADTFAQKKNQLLYYHNFIEVLGFDPGFAAENFKLYKELWLQFNTVFDAAQISLTPHAPYSVSAPLWEKTMNENPDGLMSIHNQETPEENDWFMKKKGAFAELYERMHIDANAFRPSGKTSLQTYLPNFSSSQQLILVHNVVTNQSDISFAVKRPNDIFWCLCPNANQYISSTLPDIPLFIKNDCSIVVGTDSLASNDQLDIWSEIQTIRATYPLIPLDQLLTWATSNGARALKIDKYVGSFEKGKKPGLVQITDIGAKKIYLK